MNKKGELVVYCGAMFSGKSSGLIAEIQIQLESNPNKKIKVFKPSLDTRYDLVDVKTHDGYSLKKSTGIDVIPVSTSHDFEDCNDVDFVAIDEIQFFDLKVVSHIDNLLNKGIDVVVAGLDYDSEGIPFGPMPFLLEMSEYNEELFAVCIVCDKPANKTFRKTKSGEQILVAGADVYEPRCEEHWLEGMKFRK